MRDLLAESNAGVLAAHIAADAGKLQRGYQLGAADLRQMTSTAEAFTSMREVALGTASYWDWLHGGRTSAAALVDFVVAHGLLGADEAAELAKIAYLLNSATLGAAVSELGELHDFFSRVAKEIIAAHSSSGESFSTLGQG